MPARLDQGASELRSDQTKRAAPSPLLHCLFVYLGSVPSKGLVETATSRRAPCAKRKQHLDVLFGLKERAHCKPAVSNGYLSQPAAAEPSRGKLT